MAGLHACAHYVSEAGGRGTIISRYILRLGMCVRLATDEMWNSEVREFTMIVVVFLTRNPKLKEYLVWQLFLSLLSIYYSTATIVLELFILFGVTKKVKTQELYILHTYYHSPAVSNYLRF